MTDPISDMITRIRNAYMAGKTHTSIPYSRAKAAVVEVLRACGWIGEVKERGEKTDREIIIALKYNADKSSWIRGLDRVSRPGRRVYLGKKKLPVVLNGYGSAIVSTSAGLMTNKEAKKKGLGGEVLFQVY